MDPDRKFWNRNQQALRRALLQSEDRQEMVELFLAQHALVHSSKMTRTVPFTFDDEIWRGLTREVARRIPREGQHSNAWMIWHIARIEDVTMNLLVAGGPQVLHRENWLERLGVSVCDTGNSLDEAGVAKLGAEIDIEALRAYRSAVGRRTREIVKSLRPGEIRRKVEASRLRQVKEEGAVLEEARWLIRYWRGLTTGGLLLMPPTRHNFVHLNEALRVKQKVNQV